MTALTFLLSIGTFFIGYSLGRAKRRRRDEAESTADRINRHYMQGYSAAIREFGVPRGSADKPKIVGGTDTERAS